MRRILVVRTDRLGDVIMITPMIRELRRAYPDAFIATLTTPVNSAVFLNNPHLDEALTDDLQKPTFWQVTRLLRHYRFTHGLLVFPTKRAAYQMFFAGIPWRVSVGHKLYAVLTLTRSVSRNNYIPLRHEADYCMDLVRKMGVSTDNIRPELFLKDDERSAAMDILRTKGIRDNDRKIFIHTGTGGSAPNISEASYLRIIRRILDEFRTPETKLILTAKEMTAQFRSDARTMAPSQVIDISGDTGSLRSFMAVIGTADVIITPSTGPAHIADALNIRAVGLHCHRPMSCTRHWGILNPRSVNLEVTEEYCRLHCSTDQNTCSMDNGISPEEVVAAVRHLVGDKGVNGINATATQTTRQR